MKNLKVKQKREIKVGVLGCMAEVLEIHSLRELFLHTHFSHKPFFVLFLLFFFSLFFLLVSQRLRHRLLEEEKMCDLVAGPDAYRDLPRLIGKVILILFCMFKKI